MHGPPANEIRTKRTVANNNAERRSREGTGAGGGAPAQSKRSPPPQIKRGPAFAGTSPSQVESRKLPIGFSAHSEVPPYALARALAPCPRVSPAPRRPHCRPRGRRCRANAIRPVFRKEQHPLRQVRLAHLHDRSLRDLLLPGA